MPSISFHQRGRPQLETNIIITTELLWRTVSSKSSCQVTALEIQIDSDLFVVIVVVFVLAVDGLQF